MSESIGPFGFFTFALMSFAASKYLSLLVTGAISPLPSPRYTSTSPSPDTALPISEADDLSIVKSSPALQHTAKLPSMRQLLPTGDFYD